MPAKRKALGRGLDALLPTAEPAPAVETRTKSVVELDLESIVPNPYQPREVVEDSALRELADSIRAQGVIQPVLVRRIDRRFQLVAGERRWRAARLADKTHIPAIVVDPTEQEMLEWALLENIQREDLNAIEEARAYQTLLQTTGLSQEEAAVRVGKQRSSVANSLRLLRLPDYAQQDIVEGVLTAGHGRAILAVSDPARQQRLRNEIVKRSLSVRQAEELAAKLNHARTSKGRKKTAPDPQLADLAGRMSEHLGARVAVKSMGKTRGRIEIYYHSLDDLDRLLNDLAPTST